jgi:tRNA-dihydrouridine synthase B
MGIHIGEIALSGRVVLAPLSGITDQPFRRIARRLGAALVVSEMIASRAVVDAGRRQAAERRKLIADHAAEAPLAIQLAGCDPMLMAEAARLAEAQGARLIDLNFGCPAKKVTNQDAGSALMADESLTGRILDAVVRAVSVPVSMKMRLGWRHDRQNGPALARLAEACGIKLLSVHGRTRDQAFRGRADWAAVAAVKEATRLPLLVNGDIASFADAREALERSGADGVMVGRGACGRPWFLGQLEAHLAGRPVSAAPSAAERLAIVQEHYAGLLSLYGSALGLKNARKHLGWYLEHWPGGAAWRRSLLTLEEPAAVEALLPRIFQDLREAA